MAPGLQVQSQENVANAWLDSDQLRQAASRLRQSAHRASERLRARRWPRPHLGARIHIMHIVFQRFMPYIENSLEVITGPSLP